MRIFEEYVIGRLPKYGRTFVRLAEFFERASRAFDNRQLRTFIGARTIPLPAQRAGGHRAYADWCFQAGVYASLISSLDRMPLRVLDVGCGAGVIVPGVLQALSDDSVYLGVDIDPLSIRRCRRWFKDPRARFSVVCGASPFYKIDQSEQEGSLDEICGERLWDVIIAKAVFDHLSPKDGETYLQLFSRGLEAGGVVIATFFLLDGHYRAGRAALHSRFHFDDVYPGSPGFRYSAAFNPIPEAQLAIEAERLSEILMESGLRIERMLLGTWRDPHGQRGLDMPDTLLLVRRES